MRGAGMNFIDRFFSISRLGSAIRTEITAGATTFVTMAYIIFVQPAVLSAAGMDFGAVLVATCVSSALATLMMGLYARYPLALAPGMGENFFFAYVVVVAMGIPWDTALGIVFISGILFLALSLFNVREIIINTIPPSLKAGITVGIGLFVTFIGLVFAGIIEKSPGGIVKLGSVRELHVIIPILGVLVIAVLSYFRIRGAILLGILVCALIALATGIANYRGIVSGPPSIMPVFAKMDVLKALSLDYVPLILVFLFMNVFDTVGTVVGVTRQAGLMDENGAIPRINRILHTDSAATAFGALFGTSTVTTYIESATGVYEGGRTGLTAVVTALLLALAIFIEPLARMIGGGYAVGGTTFYPIIAPALIIVGSMMVISIRDIAFDDVTEYLPAFLVMIGMPLTYSIADGLAFGFISYPALKIATGKIREIKPLVIVLGIVFVLRYAFLKV